MTEEIAIKTLISEINYELQKIVPLKDDMKLLTASFGDKTPDKFNCAAAGYLLHNFYNGFQECLFIRPGLGENERPCGRV
jgi:hypothetical protein